MIGQTLSNYRILEKLGEGGMGVVYKACETRLDRFVALKILPAEKVADPDREPRFVQEGSCKKKIFPGWFKGCALQLLFWLLRF